MKYKLGLIGKSLSHSFSRNYFSSKFQKESISDFSYELLEVKEEELSILFNNLKQTFAGVNVTIPYKEKVLSLLDEIDIHAQNIGAVNCIAFKNGKSKGYNTDFKGFADSIKEIPFDRCKKALILGTGGASKATSYSLKTFFNVESDFVSRNPQIGFEYEAISDEMMHNYGIIVNTTPLGMHPNIKSFPPINYNFITSQHFCVDLIYNPEETLFMKKCKERGALVKNGLEMLENQAELSFLIWKNNL
jgi:shikimate dehydrogenase